MKPPLGYTFNRDVAVARLYEQRHEIERILDTLMDNAPPSETKADIVIICETLFVVTNLLEGGLE